jgi:hypothetical protein
VTSKDTENVLKIRFSLFFFHHPPRGKQSFISVGAFGHGFGVVMKLYQFDQEAKRQ